MTVMDIVGHCFLIFPESKIVKRSNRYPAHYLSSSLDRQNKNLFKKKLFMMSLNLLQVINESKLLKVKIA